MQDDSLNLSSKLSCCSISSHKPHSIHDAFNDFQKPFMYHNSPETKVVCSKLNTKITYKHEKFNFDEEVFEEGYSSCGVIVVFINIVVAGYYRKKGKIYVGMTRTLNHDCLFCEEPAAVDEFSGVGDGPASSGIVSIAVLEAGTVAVDTSFSA
jgi:hypothetical protein